MVQLAATVNPVTHLSLGPLDFFDAGVGAQGGGYVREVARIVDVDIDVHVEEVGLALVHAKLDDIASGLADNPADLTQHPG